MRWFDSFERVFFAVEAFFVQRFPNADFSQSSRGGLFSFWFDAAGTFRAGGRDAFLREGEDIRMGEFDEAFQFVGIASQSVQRAVS